MNNTSLTLNETIILLKNNNQKCLVWGYNSIIKQKLSLLDGLVDSLIDLREHFPGKEDLTIDTNNLEYLISNPQLPIIVIGPFFENATKVFIDKKVKNKIIFCIDTNKKSSDLIFKINKDYFNNKLSMFDKKSALKEWSIWLKLNHIHFVTELVGFVQTLLLIESMNLTLWIQMLLINSYLN